MLGQHSTLVPRLALVLLLTTMGCSESVNDELLPEPTRFPGPSHIREEPTLLPEHRSKLSPQLKRRLLMPSTEENPITDVLLRVHGKLEQERRSALEAMDIEIRTVAGDIVTARVPFKSIPKLAALDFVRYVEISSPLYPEPKGKE